MTICGDRDIDWLVNRIFHLQPDQTAQYSDWNTATTDPSPLEQDPKVLKLLYKGQGLSPKLEEASNPFSSEIHSLGPVGADLLVQGLPCCQASLPNTERKPSNSVEELKSLPPVVFVITTDCDLKWVQGCTPTSKKRALSAKPGTVTNTVQILWPHSSSIRFQDT